MTTALWSSHATKSYKDLLVSKSGKAQECVQHSLAVAWRFHLPVLSFFSEIIWITHMRRRLFYCECWSLLQYRVPLVNLEMLMGNISGSYLSPKLGIHFFRTWAATAMVWWWNLKQDLTTSLKKTLPLKKNYLIYI